MTADLDMGGLAAVFCCVANELHVDCSNGAHKLCILNGELRLLPGVGFRQKMMMTGLHLPAKYTLHVEVDDVLESKDYTYSPIREIISGLRESCSSMKALAPAIDKLPRQCTLLVPKTLPRILTSLGSEELMKHITIPVALFFRETSGGVEVALDGSSVVISVLPNERVSFEIDASVDAPAIKLVSAMQPMRSAERFQVIYLCD